MNYKHYLKQQNRNNELFYINTLEEKVNLIGGLTTDIRWDILIQSMQQELNYFDELIKEDEELIKNLN
jgi:hypothetical protein